MASKTTQRPTGARRALALLLAALLAVSAAPISALGVPAGAGEGAPAAAAQGPALEVADAAQGPALEAAAGPLWEAAAPAVGGARDGYAESAEVSVSYADQQRTAADIVYHKEGNTAEDVSVVFLVDGSQYGAEAYRQWRSVMAEQGISYLFDHGAASDMRVVYYQTATHSDSGGLSDSHAATQALYGAPGMALGSGVPDEAYALDQALNAVAAEKADHPGRQVALVWVLSDRMNPTTDRAALEQKLQALSGALDPASDAFITWQLGADTPDELLSRYTTQHLTDPHDPASTGTASFASSLASSFRDGLRSSVEQLSHDHYHNITGVVRLAEGQTLVAGIEGASVSSESPFVSMDVEVIDGAGNAVGEGALGTAVRFTLNHVCRQSDIDVTLRVRLDEGVFEEQEVIGATVVESPRDHSNGGLHIGLFDHALLDADTSLSLPSVTLSRFPSTMTFLDAEGNEVYSLVQIAGTPVVIPSADGVGSADGENPNPNIPTHNGMAFGGWYGSDGSRYGAGATVTMPEGDVTLKASYGRAYAELDLGEVSRYEPGNRLAPRSEVSLNLAGVTLDDGVTLVSASDIASVIVEDRTLTYVEDPTAADRRHVSVYGDSSILYARWVGAADDDRVVAYLTRSATDPNKYDIRIAGRGGASAPANSFQLFRSMPGTTYDLTLLDTSDVVNMFNMFDTASATSIDVSTWDTSSVTSMLGMFSACRALSSIDLSGWNTTNVTTVREMFSGCSSLTSVNAPHLVTASVNYADSMFNSCSSLSTVTTSDWDTSGLLRMNWMFCNCSKLENLDTKNWDTSAVQQMQEVFYGCTSLTSLDASSWNTSNVTSMYQMFYYCSKLAEIKLGTGWDTSKVTNMYRMFWNCQSLASLDVSTWDVSKVTNMYQTFLNCYALERLDVSKWNTSAVTNMSGTFASCRTLTALDVSNWGTSAATTMASMFSGCSQLASLDVSKWDTSAVTTMASMFQSCSSLASLGDMSKWDTSAVTTMASMFQGCSSLASLDSISNWDTSAVTNMSLLFRSCSSLTSLDLSKWNTSAVTNMNNLFCYCSSLASLDVSNWDTASVTNMSYTFYGCGAPELDLSSWNTAQVTTMSEMFRSSKVVTLNLGDHFDASKVSTTKWMFRDTPNITTVKGLMRFSEDPNAPSKLSDCSYMFYGSAIPECTFMAAPDGHTYYFSLSSLGFLFQGAGSLKTVSLSGWNLPNLTSTYAMFSNCRNLSTIDLSWVGRCGFELAASPSTAQAFFSVPTTATLEIGTDTAARPSLDMIANAFLATSGRSVTAGGVPYTPPAAASAALAAAEEALADEAPVADEAEPADRMPADEEAPGNRALADGIFPDGQGAPGPEGSQADEEEAAPAGEEAAREEAAGPAEGPLPSDSPTAVSPQEGAAAQPSATATAPASSAARSGGAVTAVASARPGSAATAAAARRGAVTTVAVARPGSAATSAATAPAEEGAAAGAAAPAPGALAAAARAVAAAAREAASAPAAQGEEGTDWVWGDDARTLRVNVDETGPATEFTYRLRVGYSGDVGARSARISFELPVPEGIEVVEGDDVVAWSGVLSDGTDGGFRGGHIVDEPTLASDRRSVSGSIEGLYAGNYIEVTLSCRIMDQHFDHNDYSADGFDYEFWDAIGSISSSGNAGTSNWYRLWHADQDGADMPEESDKYSLTYSHEGDVPGDVTVPAPQRLKAGATIILPAAPTDYDWYRFEGWKVGDDVLQPGETITMPASDLKVVGQWKRDPSGIPNITVRYRFADPVPSGAEALLPAESSVPVGRNEEVASIRQSADYSSFAGYWVPTLTVNSADVPLTRDTDAENRNSRYTGTFKGQDGSAYRVSIPAMGPLGTMQFSPAFEGAGESAVGEVVITYTGSWVPWRGTIFFDGSGAQGTPPLALGDVTRYDDRELPDEGSLMAPEGYKFAGWALTPGGAVAKRPGDSASGIIGADGQEVTLYAKWVRADGYDIVWDLTHVSAPDAAASASYGDTVASVLVPDEGYFIDAVSIVSAGVDITSSAWDAAASTVSFSVGGDARISATAVRGLRVSYAYTGDVPAGAAAVPEPAWVRHSGTHDVAAAPTCEGYTFQGWAPALFVDGEQVALGEDGSWEPLAGARTAGSVPGEGVLDASQFEELLRQDVPVEVRYTGVWARDAQAPGAEDPAAPGGDADGPADPADPADSAGEGGAGAPGPLGKLLARTGDPLAAAPAALAGAALLAAALALAARRRRSR